MIRLGDANPIFSGFGSKLAGCADLQLGRPYYLDYSIRNSHFTLASAIHRVVWPDVDHL